MPFPFVAIGAIAGALAAVATVASTVKQMASSGAQDTNGANSEGAAKEPPPTQEEKLAGIKENFGDMRRA